MTDLTVANALAATDFWKTARLVKVCPISYGISIFLKYNYLIMGALCIVYNRHECVDALNVDGGCMNECMIRRILCCDINKWVHNAFY